MRKSFFDDDLSKTAPAELLNGDEPENDGGGDAPERSGAESPERDASYYRRQRQALPEEVATRSDEIQRLRQRQEDLERQKKALVDLRRRLDEYEEGRRDLLNRLGRGIVLLRKEEEQASRMATVCSESRGLFERLKNDVQSIQSDRWNEAEFEGELTEALARIESARQAYRKALDRVNANAWRRNESDEPIPPETRDAAARPGFLYWLVAGSAFLLPLLIFLGLIFGLFSWRMGWWLG